MPKVVINEERCKGCGLCEAACPKKLIKLKQDTFNQKGFHPAGLVDEEKCIGCAFCATMCPDALITVEK